MKIFVRSLWLSLACAQCLMAQVAVTVVFDQDRYLADETLIAKVRIKNTSGRLLAFGKDNNWLTFEVDYGDHVAVSQRQAVSVQGEFTLESGMTAIKRVELSSCYDVTRPAHYQVVATVRVAQWGQSFASPPRSFDITSGTILSETVFGMPSAARDGPPEVRKYVLQRTVDMKEMKLYARVTDATGSSSFRVTAIGPMVSFTNPEIQLDKTNNFNVLFQTGARSFNYCVLDPEGKLIRRQTFDYTSSRPILRSDKEGNLVVVGGVRRIASTDLPLPVVASSRVDAKPPAP